MADIAKVMRRLADELEKEEAGEATAATEERIAKLERQLANASRKDKRDALDDLTDDERALIVAHRASLETPAPEPEPQPEPEPVEEPAARKTRPGRKGGQAYTWTVDDGGKVQRVDIPTIYNGPDEPDEVELADESAAA